MMTTNNNYALVSSSNPFRHLGICLEADNYFHNEYCGIRQIIPTKKGEKGLRCLNTISYHQDLVLNKVPSFYQQKCNEKLGINTVLEKLRVVTEKYLGGWIGNCFSWAELEELCKNRESSDNALDDAEKDCKEDSRIEGEIKDRLLVEKRKQIGTICDDDVEYCCPALVDNLIDYLEIDKLDYLG